MPKQLFVVNPADNAIWRWAGSFWRCTTAAQPSEAQSPIVPAVWGGVLWGRFQENDAVGMCPFEFDEEGEPRLAWGAALSVSVPAGSVFSSVVNYRGRLYWLGWSGTGPFDVYSFDGLSIQSYQGSGPGSWEALSGPLAGGLLQAFGDRLLWTPTSLVNDQAVTRLLRLDLTPTAASVETLFGGRKTGMVPVDAEGALVPIAACSHRGALKAITADGRLVQIDPFDGTQTPIQDLRTVSGISGVYTGSTATPHLENHHMRTAHVLHDDVSTVPGSLVTVKSGKLSGENFVIAGGEQTNSGYEWRLNTLEGEPLAEPLPEGSVISVSQAWLSSPSASLVSDGHRLCGAIGSAAEGTLLLFSIDASGGITSRTIKGTACAGVQLDIDSAQGELHVLWNDPIEQDLKHVRVRLDKFRATRPQSVFANTSEVPALVAGGVAEFAVGTPSPRVLGAHFKPATRAVELSVEVQGPAGSLVTTCVEYDCGNGWEPATAKTKDPAHTLASEVEPGTYTFVHDVVADPVGPTSLQYRVTVSA